MVDIGPRCWAYRKLKDPHSHTTPVGLSSGPALLTLRISKRPKNLAGVGVCEIYFAT